MIDDRISRYLHEQAGSISLPPAGPAQAASRARQRRRHRRLGAAAGMALVIGAGALIVTGGGRDQSAGVSSDGGAVAPSPFDWSLVDADGDGLARHPVPAFAEDGTVYSLSTAPAPQPAGMIGPAVVYRSDDGGVSWSSLGVPNGVSATALGAQDGNLYVVGTAPGGGEAVAYRFGRSDDGGETWAISDLGGVLDEVTARYENEVFAHPASVAAHGDTVVATVSVSGHLDLAARIGGFPADVEYTEDGVVVVVCPDAAVPEAAQRALEEEQAKAIAEALEARRGQPPVPPEVPACGSGPGSERSYTWEELDVDDELRELVLDGRTYVFTSRDGAEFEVNDLGGWWNAPAQVVATDEGFALFQTQEGGESGTTEVLLSTDGVAWEPVAELDGWAQQGAGTIGGRPAVALTDDAGVRVHVMRADGTWLAADPGDAVAGADAVGPVAIGPLGWAAVVVALPDGPQVVHSVDGATISQVPLDDVAAGVSRVDVSPMVTADAVVVTLTGSSPPGAVAPRPEPLPQNLVVGTPRG